MKTVDEEKKARAAYEAIAMKHHEDSFSDDPVEAATARAAKLVILAMGEWTISETKRETLKWVTAQATMRIGMSLIASQFNVDKLYTESLRDGIHKDLDRAIDSYLKQEG